MCWCEESCERIMYNSYIIIYTNTNCAYLKKTVAIIRGCKAIIGIVTACMYWPEEDSKIDAIVT